MVIRNREMLERDAPAVFAEGPEKDRVSNKYSFLPTTAVLEILGEEGWNPWKASQVKSRSWSARHAKHLIRLRHDDFGVGSIGDEFSFPEMVLVNAHNGIASYSLFGGIFRFLCSNGIIISEQDFGKIDFIHRNFEANDVVEASKKFVNQISNVASIVKDWNEVTLDANAKEQYFVGAACLRFDAPSNQVIQEVSSPRQIEDTGNSAWTVFNVAQENLIKGGYLNDETGRRVKPITSIQRDIELNTSLWNYTREFLKYRIA